MNRPKNVYNWSFIKLLEESYIHEIRASTDGNESWSCKITSELISINLLKWDEAKVRNIHT